MKNVVAALVELAAELGLPLNLGGGISPGDRARGVQARLRQPRAALAHLGDRLRPRRPTRGSQRGRERGRDFFPAYRAGPA